MIQGSLEINHLVTAFGNYLARRYIILQLMPQYRQIPKEEKAGARESLCRTWFSSCMRMRYNQDVECLLNFNQALRDTLDLYSSNNEVSAGFDLSTSI